MKANSDIRILVVDDDFFVSQSITRTIKKIGYQVCGVASDGRMAVEMTGSERPDLIVMDIEMPNMSGIEAAQRIMEERPTPILILSAHNATQLVDESVKQGVMAYLSKPIDDEEFKRAVTVAMARFDDLMIQKRLVAEKEALNQQLKQSSERLQEAYQEKDTLLQELQHRVKNSFAIVYGMISLMRQPNQSAEVKSMLAEISSRVLAVSELYDLLYTTQSVRTVQLDRYLQRVTASLPMPGKNMTLSYQLDPVTVLVKKAVPLGLIVTELMTNAAKYAFPDGRTGKIELSLKQSNTGAILEVKDDGIGLPEDQDMIAPSSKGLKLIRSLAEQINGEIELEGGDGTRCVLTFPVEVGNPPAK